MNITQLWRYPVKSVGGEQLKTADITEFGLAGDRRWGIRDKETGMILTARREPKLLMARAQVNKDGSPEIWLPDVESPADDDALSAWLDKDVSIVRAGSGEATYESPTSAGCEDHWYTWTGPGVALHDESFARISLISETTLGAWDVRRIRPNVVVSGGGEIGFLDQKVLLGSAVLNAIDVIPRCVMVTRPQPGLARDLEVLKSINRDFDGRLSVGAVVITPGSVAIGDPLTKL